MEFAIVLPLLLLVLLITIDFGRLFFAYVQVNNAAREAAAYAGVNPTQDANIVTRAIQETNAQGVTPQGEAQSGLSVDPAACFDPSPSTPTSIPCASAAVGTSVLGYQIKVSVHQPFTFLTPLIGNFFGGGLTLNASATAPVYGTIEAASTTYTITTTTTTGTTTTTTTTTATTTTCVQVPAVTGKGSTPAKANTAISGAGLVPNGVGDLTTGNKGEVASQSPSAGSCVALGSTVTYHYRP